MLDALALLTSLYQVSIVTLTSNTTAIIDGELSCKLLGLIVESKLKHFLQLPLNNNNNNSNNILYRDSTLQFAKRFHIHHII